MTIPGDCCDLIYHALDSLRRQICEPWQSEFLRMLSSHILSYFRCWTSCEPSHLFARFLCKIIVYNSRAISLSLYATSGVILCTRAQPRSLLEVHCLQGPSSQILPPCRYHSLPKHWTPNLCLRTRKRVHNRFQPDLEYFSKELPYGLLRLQARRIVRNSRCT